MVKEYHTINQIAGPLVFVEKTEPVGFGELVVIALPDGSTKRGQVLDTSDEVVVLPQPDGPIIARTSLPLIVQSRPRRAMTSDLPVL